MDNRIEEIKLAVEAAEKYDLTTLDNIHPDVYRLCTNSPEWLLYLLQQNEQLRTLYSRETERLNDLVSQQKAENRTLKDKVNQLRGDRDNWKEECEEYRLQLQQSRDENERLKIALRTHQSYDKSASELHEENERLRGELERYEERRQTAALEVGKLVIEYDQVKAERDDYRKGIKHYADRRNHPPFWLHDDGQLARDILSRYPEKGE